MENRDKKKPWYRNVDGYDVFEIIVIIIAFIIMMSWLLPKGNYDDVWNWVICLFVSLGTAPVGLWVVMEILDFLGFYGTRICDAPIESRHKEPRFVVEAGRDWGKCARCGEFVWKNESSEKWQVMLPRDAMDEHRYVVCQLEAKRKELGLSADWARGFYSMTQKNVEEWVNIDLGDKDDLEL